VAILSVHCGRLGWWHRVIDGAKVRWRQGLLIPSKQIERSPKWILVNLRIAALRNITIDTLRRPAMFRNGLISFQDEAQGAETAPSGRFDRREARWNWLDFRNGRGACYRGRQR
jgi:hypothetical protein